MSEHNVEEVNSFGASVEITDVHKSFGSVGVLQEVNLTIQSGEVVFLLGASGCGKTTLLRIIAGLESLDKGRIALDEIDVSRVPTKRREIGFVFQDYALFPNMTVEKNLIFALRNRGKTKKEQWDDRVADALRLVDLSHLAKRYPRQLSGGQQQRIAIARAMCSDPKLLLMDEPLSSVDAAMKETIRWELADLIRKVGITTICVSHDFRDAAIMADKVAIMERGYVAQVGSPMDVYRSPGSLGAGVLSGRMNRMAGVAKAVHDGVVIVDVSGVELRVPCKGDSHIVNTEVVIGVRPENVFVQGLGRGPSGEPGAGTFKGRVAEVTVGEGVLVYEIVSDVGAALFSQAATGEPLLGMGEMVAVSFEPKGLFVWEK